MKNKLSRKEKILCCIDKKKIGIEIGPGHSPVAPKKKGYNVQVIDHLDKKGLLKKFHEVDTEKYGGVNVDPENVEEVDFVWHGERYKELTGHENYYDWVIASHLIEHTPDLISFINQCDEVLNEDGVLSLAIPDKRYCFDRFRPITGLSKVIDAHQFKHTRHTSGTTAEYYLNVVTKGGRIGWNNLHKGKYENIHDIEECKAAIEKVNTGEEYMDFHAWCFTPTSFRLLINDLNMLGLISLKEVKYFPSNGYEFFITLGKKGHDHPDRLEMLREIEREQSITDSIDIKSLLISKANYIKRKVKKLIKRGY